MTAEAPTHAALLAEGSRVLAGAGVEDAARDARRLLAHSLDIAPARLALFLPDTAEPGSAKRFRVLIARRAERVPVSQLVGTRTFFGREFRVTRDVLDPRPETETLVATALETDFRSVLDLGTGSGCILLTLLAERANATGLGTDVSDAALAVAEENRRALGLGSRSAFSLGEWWQAVPDAGRYDLIVSNPPYIAATEMQGLSPEVRNHEPDVALTDGGDGLSAYRAIASGLSSHLLPGGRVLLEIGPTQADDVACILRVTGLEVAAPVHDMDGRPRVMVAELR